MNLQRIQAISTPEFRSGDGVRGAAPPAGGHDGPIFRLNLLRALQLHRRLAVGIALGCLLLAVAYVVKAWPVYTAQSQIYVQPVQSRVMAGANEQGWPNNPTTYDSFIQQQVQSASNPDVLLSALHKLKPGTWQRSGESERTAADRLGGAIEVARAGTSYEVTINAKAKDPQLVAQIANAVATSIVERASGEGNAGNAERINVLTDERNRIQNQLTSDYAEQSELNKQLGMAAVGTEAPDLIDSDIGKTREELIKAQTDHDQAAARFTAMGAGKGDTSAAIDADADDLVAADAGLTSMKTSLNSRRATLITQMANLTPTNPEYKQDATELAKINGDLESMMKDLRAKAAARIQQKLKMDLERTAGVEAKLNGQLRQLAGTAAGATPKLQRASDLATDISRLRTRYTSVDEQLHNLMLENSAPGAVHLSVAAVPPLHPAVSGILKKALPLALGGLLLGLLAASIANHLDPKVYIGADIEQVLGFAPMAVLPDFDEVSEEVSAEHLLRLSSAIEHARRQGSLNNCIFTGTAAGVGVTTLATRVRDVLEAMGRPTVLLDSSGTPAPPARASERRRATDEEAAKRGSRSTALLRQVAAETEMQQESLVLTDTAPLPISAETEYLARFVDCAIVVVESGVTTRAQLLAAVNTLQRLDVAAMGFVLNRVKLEKADPAFRRSMQDIEEHHQAQSMSAARRAVRTSPMPDECLPDAKELPSESSVPANSAPAAPEPAPEPPVRRQPHAAPQWITAAPVKPWLPQPKQTSSSADLDTPWWLLDVHSTSAPLDSEVETERESEPPAPSRPAPQSPSIPVQSLEDANSWSDDFVPLTTPRAAPIATREVVAAPPEKRDQKLDWFTAQEAVPRVAETIAPFTLREAAAMAADKVVQLSAERIAPIAAGKAAPAVAPEGAHVTAQPAAPAVVRQPEREAIPDPPAPRLISLRGLLFSTGVKNLGKMRESVPQAESAPLLPKIKTESTVAASIASPMAEPVPIAAAPVAAAPVEAKVVNTSPKRDVGKEIPEVTAQPEFLPPREFVPVKQNESPLEPAPLFRGDRRDEYDDLQILPSRRGQYKRRG